MEREHNGDPAHAAHDQAPRASHDEPATGAEQAVPAAEPEHWETAADMEHAPPPAPAHADAADLSSPPPMPPAEQETPRRRSTVREPAPGAAGGETSPPQPKATEQPVFTELSDGEATDRPRRSGWWSKRIVGG